MQLTDRDHLRWSITDVLTGKERLFGKRKHDQDKFNFSLGKITSPTSCWWVEFNRAVEKLVDTHGSNLALFYSGGSDSEIVLRSLLDKGVKPTIHTIKFKNGYNSHETNFADEFCKSVGLKQVVWDHDVDDFIASQKYLDIGLKYSCTQIAYITVVEYVRRVDVPAIMGGEVYFQKHAKNDLAVKSPFEWYYIYREDEDGMTYRYSQDTGHPLINEVFTYTPEVLYSWLKTPEVKAVANNEVPGKLTLLTVKKAIYEREMGLKLIAKTKFHGYESMTWRNAMIRRHIAQHLPKMKVAKLEYSSLLEYMES
jgi:hypothetical protein